MAWSENSGTKLVANIYPTGKFPTHHAIFGRGGYKTVANEAERLAIPLDRLTVGSIVRQHDTGIEWVVTSIPSSYDSDTATGENCTWEPIKQGGFSEEETLNALKGKADLDTDGKVKEDQSRALIYKGVYVNETTFNSASGQSFSPRENAIYISNDGKIYTWNGDKFVRDALYWITV